MKDFLFMLVIINPFAQILYLAPLMDRISFRNFVSIHLKASLLSYGVFALFVVFGEPILKDLFQVRLASLQIFGGLIMLFIAHRYITVGPGSNLLFRGDISELAPKISLPYMVGPGTIWVSILIGKNYFLPVALGMVAAVLAINYLFVVGYHLIHKRMDEKVDTLPVKYFAILMRTNALFIGAISVEMVVRGIGNLFPNAFA